MDILSVIRNRKTAKILVNPETPWPVNSPDQFPISEILEAGRYAPFHYPAHKSHKDRDSSIFPWKAYLLDAENCRNLLVKLQESGQSGGKIFGLLAAAEKLAIVSWKPNPPSQPSNDQLFDPTLENMEHICAASAAIQNMLLTATSHGIPNYWSSGGILRDKRNHKLLGIHESEIVLGALFFFPKQVDFPTQPDDIVPGKLAALRGDESHWVQPVQVSKTSS